MNDLTARFRALKKSLPGNRERLGFEDTFGQPREEAQHITMQSEATVRIISELDFVIRLSAERDGGFDGCIDKALTFLEGKAAAQSALTDGDCLEAEKMLMPAAKAAKEYSVILVGHAHIDMNWMWGWNETVAATLATFRTVLMLMREYPDFCFSQSQASVYKIVEDYAPEMMPEIKQRIKEGRWEVTASAWVETDKNMPDTESLLRHIKYTKNYLKETWDIDPDDLKIDFSPDTFGHSANLPEIDKQGNVEYYYHCRALDGPYTLYRWRGQSGKETLNYVEQFWYNSSMQPFAGIGVIELSKRSGGLKTGLTLYGVGDHGGGPTRRDVERAIKIASWPVFPQYRFGTLREYFALAESVRDKLPVVDREMNFIFTGCYTTQSRIKMANRRCEAALSDAENLGAFSQVMLGTKYDLKGEENAYRDVLFSHFHDIITGSNVRDSREYAMGMMQRSHAFAQTAAGKAMREIADSADTSAFTLSGDLASSQAEGAGPGYNADFGYLTPAEERGGGTTRVFTVFNPTPAPRKDLAEITVWDWTGDLRLVTVKDAEGKELEFTLIDTEMQRFWDHKFFRFAVSLEMPPLSYTCLALSEKEIDTPYPFYFNSTLRSHHPTDDFVLENDLVRAEFDFSTGEMLSFIDKESGEECIKNGCRAGFVLIDTESASSDAWRIGRYLSIKPVSEIREIRAEDKGELRKGFFVKAKVLDSTVEAHVSLDKYAKTVRIRAKADWNEVGGETVPVLAYRVPVRYEVSGYRYNIPGGSIVRKPCELDHPGLSYIAAAGGKAGDIGIVTDCKYGFRGRSNGDMISTLINTATYPDPYPERGVHEFTLNVGLISKEEDKAEYEAVALNRPLTYQPTLPRKGTLPYRAGLFDCEMSGAVISAVAPSDDSRGLIVRLYNPTDDTGSVKLKMPFTIDDAFAADLFENKIDGSVSFSGDTVGAELPPKAIMTIKIIK